MFSSRASKLSVAMLVLSLSPSVAGSDISVDQIISDLTPKARTRSVAAPTFSLDQINVLNRIKSTTRGLSANDRSALGGIVTRSILPALDLEVNFAFNSDKLEPQSVLILARLGSALSSDKLEASSFILAGHTDAVGSKDYNQRLSESRAATVKNFLIQNFKIDAQKLIVVGYGQEMPKNRQNPFADENRRVQVLNLGQNTANSVPALQVNPQAPATQVAQPPPPSEPVDPLAPLDGTWVAVNPPGPQINFYKAGLGQRMASLAMGQASIGLSDGASGSHLRVSGEGFNCYYAVGFVSSDEMTWQLKQGDAACLSTALYKKGR